MKKRKLNSKNPKYNKDKNKEKVIKKQILISQGPNQHTNVKFKCEGIWFENN